MAPSTIWLLLYRDRLVWFVPDQQLFKKVSGPPTIPFHRAVRSTITFENRRTHQQRRLWGEFELLDQRRHRDEQLVDHEIGILRVLLKPLVGICIATEQEPRLQAFALDGIHEFPLGKLGQRRSLCGRVGHKCGIAHLCSW